MKKQASILLASMMVMVYVIDGRMWAAGGGSDFSSYGG